MTPRVASDQKKLQARSTAPLASPRRPLMCPGLRLLSRLQMLPVHPATGHLCARLTAQNISAGALLPPRALYGPGFPPLLAAVWLQRRAAQSDRRWQGTSAAAAPDATATVGAKPLSIGRRSSGNSASTSQPTLEPPPCKPGRKEVDRTNGTVAVGRLVVIKGPMFAGKTTALLDRVKNEVLK